MLIGTFFLKQGRKIDNDLSLKIEVRHNWNTGWQQAQS